MSTSESDRKSPTLTRAQEQFRKATQRDTDVRKEIEKQQSATIAKIAKLKALRLAKEASDRETAEAEALANPPKKPAAAKKRKSVPAK